MTSTCSHRVSSTMGAGRTPRSARHGHLPRPATSWAPGRSVARGGLLDRPSSAVAATSRLRAPIASAAAAAASCQIPPGWRARWQPSLELGSIGGDHWATSGDVYAASPRACANATASIGATDPIATDPITTSAARACMGLQPYSLPAEAMPTRMEAMPARVSPPPPEPRPVSPPPTAPTVPAPAAVAPADVPPRGADGEQQSPSAPFCAPPPSPHGSPLDGRDDERPKGASAEPDPEREASGLVRDELAPAEVGADGVGAAEVGADGMTSAEMTPADASPGRARRQRNPQLSSSRRERPHGT